MRGEPDPYALHNAVLEDLARPRSAPAPARRTSTSSAAEALPVADAASTRMRGRGVGVSGGLAYVLWLLVKWSVILGAKLAVGMFKVALWPFVEITRSVQRFDRWGDPVD